MALYVSPYKNFCQVVRHRTPLRWDVSGSTVLEWQERLAAEFGQLGDETAVLNPLTGEMTLVADIRTGVYDTLEAQRQNGWTDAERELVEWKLDEVARMIPSFVQKLVPQHVPAPRPWVSYDETSGERVVAIAAELRLVPEALRYERENLNRSGIVAALEAALEPGDEARAEPLEEIRVNVPKSTPEAPAARVGKRPRTTTTGVMVDTPGLESKGDVLQDAPEATVAGTNLTV